MQLKYRQISSVFGIDTKNIYLIRLRNFIDTHIVTILCTYQCHTTWVDQIWVHEKLHQNYTKRFKRFVHLWLYVISLNDCLHFDE